MTNLPAFKSDIEMDKDAILTFQRMVVGSLHIDHNGDLSGRDGKPTQLKAIHYRTTAEPDVEGGEFYGHDAMSHAKLLSAPFFYLEGEDGSMVAFENARPAINSKWHFGILLMDEEGQGWFCGREDVKITSHGSAEAEDYENAKLFRVSLDTLPIVLSKNGELRENLPAEGEFWISEEEMPNIVSIPWWSLVVSDIDVDKLSSDQIGYRAKDIANLEGIKDRIETLTAIEQSAVACVEPE